MSTKEFFTVSSLDAVLGLLGDIPQAGFETVSLSESLGRILAREIVSDIDIPDFNRSTMDGYAVRAVSTFGASGGMPALFAVTGEIEMGKPAGISVKSGEAVRIPTGGMLPDGADSVVMLEHAEPLDDRTLEVFKSVAPLQHVIEIGEDLRRGDTLSTGQPVRAQDMGLLAALGMSGVPVFKKPVVAIISTGDEIVDIHETPDRGRLRDINAYTLTGLIMKSGGIPLYLGIAPDRLDELVQMCREAVSQADIILVSGGSSVGARDLTKEAIKALPDSGILAHGISISPGKPTIVARIGEKAFLGLPGHVASAMIVFMKVVQPLVERIGGLSERYRGKKEWARAVLSRNLASVQGRSDFVRVRLIREEGRLLAQPVLGKSGLIRTMVHADGLIEIDINSEGLNKGSVVDVELI
ncbi:MAG: molybdopterin molybdotransferase MoeA [Deltaproteobacteria bacterium]|jgi:molybdopterin molybdotransferase|nr:molybdopterin molybdotransferase MoeA [Deltaproteobacteria bacterium]